MRRDKERRDECHCRWDGNLDGRFIRCRKHPKVATSEVTALKRAEQIIEIVKSHSRPVRLVVELAEAKVDG